VAGLWKRYGLPSVSPGGSPLPDPDQESQMSTAPEHHIVHTVMYVQLS